MALDLNTHGAALQKAVDQLVSNQSIDWILFGYEGQNCTLKVVSTGEDGLEELVEEFSCSKIQYGYCRVMDTNTSLPKYVFVNWQGESAPEKMKALSANHTNDVQRFCKTIHVRINARNEDDLDVDDITKQVASASGANYSVHKEKPQRIAPADKVGSVYQKVNAQNAISNKEREEYWAKVEAEEKTRRNEDAKRAAEEKTALEAEHRRRDAQSAAQRDAVAREHTAKVSALRRAESTDNETERKRKDSERERWEREQQEMARDEDERKRRADSLREQRIQEAQQLVKQGGAADAPQLPSAARSREDASYNISSKEREEYWAKVEAEEKNRRDEDAKRAATEKTALEAEHRRRDAQSAAQRDAVAREHTAKVSALRRAESTDNETERKRKDSERERWEREQQEMARDEDERKRRADSLREQRIQEAQQLAGRRTSQTSEPAPAPVRREAPAPVRQEPPAPIRHESPPPQTGWNDDDEITENPQYASSTTPAAPASSNTRNAVALYDYQADADDEISFDPGELITDIEVIDDGWWVGTNTRGQRGLFPANYVQELVN